jgi:hypothetical protein
VATASWSQLEFRRRQARQLRSQPHDGSSTSFTHASLPAIIITFYTPFPSPPFAYMITKGRIICHLQSRRGTIRRRGRSWKERWFLKKSSNGEGVFIWSVLLLVAVINLHTLNNSDVDPLDPIKRNFIIKGACRSVY